MGRSIASIGFQWFSASLLVACVVEMNDPILQNVDPQRFIQVSVAAASEYIQDGNTESAFKHLNNVLEKDPKSAEAHNLMALVYRLTGDKVMEEKHFKLAIRYAPGLSKIRNNYATYLYNEGRYQDALHHLRRASKDPGYEKRAAALQNMGLCYLKLGEVERAQQAFTEAVRVDEQMVRSHLELARLYFEKDQLSEAANALVRYGAVARHTPQSLWIGIQVQRVLGNKDALASYELALRQLYPDSEEYQAYSQTLVTE